MKRIICLIMFIALCQIVVNGEVRKNWCGGINAEISFAITGAAGEFDYKSIGVAGGYGLLLNDHYFVGLGVKPNYIFSDDDFNGFFLPIYGEFKYKSSLTDKYLGGYGVVRAGYSPTGQGGAYAHIGGGLLYKKWEFGLGISYQNATFKETWDKDVWYCDYNIVFATLSVGYYF